MASFAGSGDSEESLFDNSRPFAGVVICCTSIPPEHRASIASKTEELGGVHKYDLTPDCTHLIVGEYDTPKYRHVAKERPDVKCMDAHWVTAVRDMWIQDADIDFPALEKEWQLKTFESAGGDPTPDGSVPKRSRLLCCMTGFEDFDVRQDIIDKIKAHGGDYTGDLSKRVTHLIAYKPAGAKYQAAKNWGIHTVSIEWVNDSIERGLILEERLYDPVLSPEERGVGAWNRESLKLRVKLGKRLRETSAANKEEGRRKLRKTASMKLSTQRDHLWGDILGKPKVEEPAPVAAPQPQIPAPSEKTQPHPTPTQRQSGARSMDTQGTALSSLGRQDESVIFASCCFYIHGFEQKKYDILANVIGSLGGLVCHSLEEVVSASGAQLSHRFLAVPQSSSPDSHPPLPENVNIITEFYIEKCMHTKYFFDPREHVIGRPFPVFPIPGFERLSISTAGFTGVDLNQVDKAIRQLGATYQETFNAQASVLICVSLEKVRQQKLDLAVAWKVPVVSNEWLWQCISTGYNVPIDDYIFPEIKERIELQRKKDMGKEKEKSNADKRSKLTQDQVDPDLVPKARTKPKKRGFDVSGLVEAFKTPEPTKQQAAAKERRGGRSALALQEPGEDSFANAHFETAPTHQMQFNTDSNSGNSTTSSNKNTASAPLSEASNNSLNKTPRSTQKQGKGKEVEDRSQPQQISSRKPLSRVFSEVADSEATEGDLGSADEFLENENVNQQEEEESPEEIERKRIEAEKEADRLALASRFASMIESGAAIAAGSFTEESGHVDIAAAASGRGGLTRVLSETGMVGISIGLGLGSGSGVTTTAPPTRRRKPKIFGRAQSNVSTASSGSADSVAAGVVTGAGQGSSNALAAKPEGGNGNGKSGGGSKRAGSGVTTAADNGDTAAATMTEDPIVTSVSDNDKAADVKSDKSSVVAQQQQEGEKPSSTQLEYKDPEANRNRARLMHKMRGVAGSGTHSDGGASLPKGGSFIEEKPEGKLTLADLGGYEVNQKQGGYGSNTTSRRVTRRRG